METVTITYHILKEWVAAAPPLERIVYHVGYGATDSKYSSEIASYIYKQAVRGTVYLVRRRNPQDKRLFEYIAVKASPTPVFSLLPLPQDQLEIMYRKGAKNVKIRKYRSSDLLTGRIPTT